MAVTCQPDEIRNNAASSEWEDTKWEFSTYCTNQAQPITTLSRGNTSAFSVPENKTYFHNKTLHGSHMQHNIQIPMKEW